MAKCCGSHLGEKIKEYAKNGIVKVIVKKNITVFYGIGEICESCTSCAEFDITTLRK